MQNTCPQCHWPVDSINNTSLGCSFGCYFLSKYQSKNLLPRIRFGLGVLVVLFLAFGSLLLSGIGLSLENRALVYGFLGVLLLLTLGLPVYQSASVLWAKKQYLESDLLFLLPITMDMIHSAHKMIYLDFTSSSDIDTPFLISGLLFLVIYLVAVIETKLRLRAHQDIDQIVALKPQTARVITKNKQEMEIPVCQIKLGDLLKINAGEIIPCDGMIVQGTTSVDESMFTSENSIYLKAKGDPVTGASLNRDSTILIEVTNIREEHFLEQVSAIVKTLLKSPTALSSGVARFVKWFTLFVWFVFVVSASFLLFEGATALLPWLVKIGIILSLFSMVRLLPLMSVLGMGKALHHGILLPSVNQLKKVAKLDTLFFDKTGTLTTGNFYFSQLYLEKGVNQGTFLSTLFSLEAHIDNLIAKGVQTHPWYNEFSFHEVKEFVDQPGLGICGKITERGKSEIFACVGNQRFLKRMQMQISRSMRERLEELESMGETVLLCGWAGQAKGIFSLADTLRPDVKFLLHGLTKLKIEPIMMTSDNDGMISHLSVTHDLKHIYSRCLPQEKINKIEKRRANGELTGTVGSPLDDPSVLQHGDIEIVLGTGTRLPAYRQAIVILGQHLTRITQLIGFSRTLTRLIRGGTILSLVFLITMAIALATGWGYSLILISGLTLVILFLQSFPIKLKKIDFELH